MNRLQLRFEPRVGPPRPRMVKVEWTRSPDDHFDVDVALFLAALEEPEARLLAEYPALANAWMGRFPRRGGNRGRGRF